MYELTIKNLERLPKELLGAISDYEFEKGLEDDEEMKKLHDDTMRMYDEEKLICKMIDGYRLDEDISGDPLINKLIQCYYNTRTLSEKMEERMYKRGMHDCIKWLIEIGILTDKDVQL